MKSEAVQELTLLIGSGWRVVALESFEEERALRILDAAAQAVGRSLITWSLASGMEAGV